MTRISQQLLARRISVEITWKHPISRILEENVDDIPVDVSALYIKGWGRLISAAKTALMSYLWFRKHCVCLNITMLTYTAKYRVQSHHHSSKRTLSTGPSWRNCCEMQARAQKGVQESASWCFLCNQQTAALLSLKKSLGSSEWIYLNLR